MEQVLNPHRSHEPHPLDKICQLLYISILAYTNILMNRIEELTELFKALSTPTRLRSVQRSGEHDGALCIYALSHRLEVSLRVYRSTYKEGEGTWAHSVENIIGRYAK